jgi:DnaJ-class molecular chaperone
MGLIEMQHKMNLKADYLRNHPDVNKDSNAEEEKFKGFQVL